MTDWFAIPNLNGRTPVAEPPKDRPIIVRNLQNRIVGSRQVYTTEHMAFWDGQQFVRLTDDLFREPVFVFFHVWREIDAIR